MEKDKLIKDAQYRKGLSIAFFNATNAAITMCAGMNVHEISTLEKITSLRDFFLDEHATYYANVIAKVGVNFKAKETIKLLEKVTSLDELRNAWFNLSEDERRDKEIFECVQNLKKKYEIT